MSGGEGYGKPPLHSRFEKGRSGNPRGRPKGARGYATILAQELNRRVSVHDNGGRVKSMTKLEVFLRTLVNNGMKGNRDASRQLLSLLPVVEAEREPLSPTKLSDTDKAIYDHLRKMLSKSEASDE